MTAEQEAQIQGFRAHLEVAGVWVNAGPGRMFYALVEDVSPMTEPFETARAKSAIYATVTALAADAGNPRTITTMSEATGRQLRVIEVLPVQDNAFVSWTVEVQRVQ